MITIHKYEITPDGNQPIAMPSGAIILSVGEQSDRIYVWALVNTDFSTVSRWFYVYGTGWEIPRRLGHSFVGTVQMKNGLVFHVFCDWEAA